MSITLEQLQQEVARRAGPYFTAYQATGSPTSSTATSAVMPKLQTTSLLGGPENLWLLRRGHVYGGADITVAAADRQRLVQGYDSSAGRVTVDRNWSQPMAPGEIGEFHHLDPEQELQVAIMAGLQRCFIADSIQISPTSSYYMLDITSTKPWVTDVHQVLGAHYGWLYPYGNAPFRPYKQAGHVVLLGPFGSAMWLTLRRPAWTWVNGAESTSGPVADSDSLEVDLNYAAAAAHIEAWHHFPSRMFYAAAGNLQATQVMAATEFTRQALIWAPEPETDIGFSEVVSLPLVHAHH